MILCRLMASGTPGWTSSEWNLPALGSQNDAARAHRIRDQVPDQKPFTTWSLADGPAAYDLTGADAPPLLRPSPMCHTAAALSEMQCTGSVPMQPPLQAVQSTHQYAAPHGGAFNHPVRHPQMANIFSGAASPQQQQMNSASVQPIPPHLLQGMPLPQPLPTAPLMPAAFQPPYNAAMQGLTGSPQLQQQQAGHIFTQSLNGVAPHAPTAAPHAPNAGPLPLPVQLPQTDIQWPATHGHALPPAPPTVDAAMHHGAKSVQVAKPSRRERGSATISKEAKPLLAEGRTFESMLACDQSTRVDRAVMSGLGYPMGPIVGSHDTLKSEAKAFCSNPNTHGGGWGLHFGGLRDANTKRGPQRRIGCYHSGTGCKWEVKYELTSSGWYAQSCNFPESYKDTSPDASELDVVASFSGHNHKLEGDKASVMAHRSGKYIPEELAQLAAEVAEALPAASVDAVLRRKARRQGIDVTWDETMIYDTFERDCSDGNWDMTNMYDYFKQRQEEKGLQFFLKTVSSGSSSLVVDRIFAEMDGAVGDWARGGDDNVLLFDPTAGTNMYKMKFCPFVTVGPTGQTIILAIAILNLENTAHIKWAFECFHQVFKRPPRVLFTDEGASIIAAFLALSTHEIAIWHFVVHLFCIFHISKGFWGHISPVVKDRTVFRQLTSKFWSISKATDVASIELFGEDWAELVAQVRESATDDRRSEAAIEWLDALGAKAPQFAYRYTWRHLTYLIHSTVRSEAINSAVKTKVSTSGMHLVRLAQGLDSYNTESRDKKAADSVRLALRRLTNMAGLPPWVS